MNKAFVAGSNGPSAYSPLRFARKDVDDISGCLSSRRCAFEVMSLDAGAGVWDVRRELTTLAGSCSPNDTFVCYFSGHGVLDGGSLFLLWDDTELDQLLATGLPVSAITEALRHSRARNKLLILDCCHAGAAVGSGLRDISNVPVKEVVEPENHLVLMASDRLQRTRELEELGGGFLTQELCSALSKSFRKADQDHDGRLSMDDLRQWLEQRAAFQNSTDPARDVPVPYLFGQQRGDFFLASLNAEWRRTTFTLRDCEFVLLPFQWMSERAIALGRFPVLNREYERFVAATGANEPSGELFLNGKWVSGFKPWQDERFRDPDAPVVCLDVADAQAYADWLYGEVSYEPLVSTDGELEVANRPTFVGIPTQNQWDLGAFGTMYPGRNPEIWLAASARRHDNATAPEPVDRTGTRDNSLGLADVIGNVWEWCLDPDADAFDQPPVLLEGSVVAGVEAPVVAGSVIASDDLEPDERWTPTGHSSLRGGGYLDDLRKVSPFVNEWELKERKRTRHSDVGFRLVVETELWRMDKELWEQLFDREPQVGATRAPMMPVTA